MKKLIAGVCLLVLVAACQPVSNTNTTTNANTAPETKAAAPPSEADMIAKEKAAWDAFKRKDADAFKKVLAPEYTEVTSNGIMDGAKVAAAMNDVTISDLTFADWKMTTIDKDLVLLTYTTAQKGTYKGEAFDGSYRHAAGWINRNGEWLAIYFQETKVSKETMPQPPPPSKKPAASPASSPAKIETSDDVIANEKLVWDLFRSRNFEAFQTLLATEFMETEDTGVYDKAGSVKALSEEMDASQFELGDWKAVKLDADAGLVTYTITMKGPKPMKSYHATIWAQRDGKWLGFYHQGTPAETGPAPGASPSPAKPSPPKPSPTKKM